MQRFQGHYQVIRTNNDTSGGQHFNKCLSKKDGQPSDFSTMILSFIHRQLQTQPAQLIRDTKEKRWMHHWGTILPLD